MIRTRSIALPALWALSLIFLGGCAMDQMSNIPANATMASSGDDRLAFTAPSDGTVWIYDVSRDRIVYSGQVWMNQTVSVNPDNSTINIGGRVVMDTLPPNAHRRIYFAANAAGSPPPGTPGA